MLRKRFYHFGEKQISTLNGNNKITMELIEYVLNDENEMSLNQSIAMVFDQICQYKKKEDKNENEKENEKSDLLSKAGKVEASMSFGVQFSHYFDDLLDNPNAKANFKTFLAFVLIEVATFWFVYYRAQEIQADFLYGVQSAPQKLEKLKQDIREFIEWGTANPCICDKLGMSLFHLAVTFESTEMLTLFLKLDDDLSKYYNIVGNTPSDDAMKMGNWSHVQQIARAKMGQRMKNQAKTEEKRIELKRGIVNQFMKMRKHIVEQEKEKEKEKSDDVDDEVKDEKKNENENETENEQEDKECEFEDSFLEELLNTVLKLIELQAPISDDMLFLCWKYSMSKQKKNPKHHKENRLWIELKKLICDILDDSKNKQKWIWFKQNLLSSIIWYEIVLVAQSDPILNHGISSTSGIGSDSGDSGNKKGNGIEIVSLICECGHKYDLTTPENVYKRAYQQCSACNQTKSENEYFYHCSEYSNAIRTGKVHGQTDLCLECGEIKISKTKSDKTSSRKALVNNESLKQNGKEKTNMGSGEREVVLYNELFSMANERLNKQKIKLKTIIDGMSHRSAWKDMIGYSVPGIDKNTSEDLRQDSSEHLQFPNELKFDLKKLNTLGLKDFYDTKIYLPNLMIVASALNNRFHDLMKNDILKKGT